MAIYGTAVLSLSVLIGLSLGRLLGRSLGVDADIGGVGIAMLLLIFSTDWLHRTGRMKPPTEAGIVYWSSMYIPIVVAMAASQNVLGAIGGGMVAILAGSLSVAVCFTLVGVMVRMGSAAPRDGAE
jgi:malonate transporter MadL subunit